jgi:hypothetical protein
MATLGLEDAAARVLVNYWWCGGLMVNGSGGGGGVAEWIWCWWRQPPSGFFPRTDLNRETVMVFVMA